jgi:histidine triad (HIT) family protein
MPGIFSRIVKGEIPCFKVAEDESHLAFLDIQPVSTGHVLVIPKIEIDYVFDMETEAYASLWIFARKVAVAVKQAVPCVKVGVSVIGLEVPHAHIHLVPMQTMADMNFSRPKLQPNAEELEEMQIRISQSFKSL